MLLPEGPASSAVKLGGAAHVARFDAPNVVRHAVGSGFADEMHVLPIAERRTRVLLRQHFPKNLLLDALLAAPGAEWAATAIVSAAEITAEIERCTYKPASLSARVLLMTAGTLFHTGAQPQLEDGIRRVRPPSRSRLTYDLGEVS